MNLKPSPCVGCGYCCLKMPCVAAVRIYGPIERCPALYWNEKKKMYQCKLMEIKILGERYREELAAGAGCCSPLNSWRKDVKRRTEEEIKNTGIDRLFKIFLACLSRELVSSDVLKLTIYNFGNEVQKCGFKKEDVNYLMKEVEHHIFETEDLYGPVL